MRKPLKAKQFNKDAPRADKAVNWSARRAKTLMTHRPAGRAGYCNCGK